MAGWRNAADVAQGAAPGGFRSAALSLLALRQHERPEASLRCLFGHHCFDDERPAAERLIKRLLAEGFHFVSTEHVVAVADGLAQPVGHELHLSFDDGFANVLENALPILEPFKVPVTVFVPSDAVGALPDSPLRHGVGLSRGRRPIKMADWAGLRAAVGRGLLEVGAHTSSHVRLSAVSADAKRLKEEVGDAKAEIEDHLGCPCRWFAAPYGQPADVDPGSVEAVRAAGYEALFRAYRGDVSPARSTAGRSRAITLNRTGRLPTSATSPGAALACATF